MEWGAFAGGAAAGEIFPSSSPHRHSRRRCLPRGLLASNLLAMLVLTTSGAATAPSPALYVTFVSTSNSYARPIQNYAVPLEVYGR